MLFAETVIQIESGPLVTGLIGSGAAVVTAIGAAAKFLASVLTRLHEENRKDRAELMMIVNGQWEQLSRLAQNTRVNAQATRAIQKKVGAPSASEDEEE